MAQFDPILALKRQNLGKIRLSVKAQKSGLLALLSLDTCYTLLKGPKILTDFGSLERVYQVSRPEKANKRLYWAFSVKRMILYRSFCAKFNDGSQCKYSGSTSFIALFVHFEHVSLLEPPKVM